MVKLKKLIHFFKTLEKNQFTAAKLKIKVEVLDNFNGYAKLRINASILDAWDNISWALDQLNIDIEDKDINRVFECTGVVRYMFWLGKRAVVKQSEVDILKKYLKGDYNLINSKLSNIKVGDNVNLSSFNNEKGIVDRISKNNIWIYVK